MLHTRVTRCHGTTVPRAVREALRLHPGDSLAWEIHGDEAVVRRASATPAEGEDDPALEPFLRLLAADIEAHPERLQGLPEHLYRTLLEITAGVEFNPDEPIEGPVAL